MPATEQEKVITRAELTEQEEASIAKIQAHARGSRVRKSCSMEDQMPRLTPRKTSKTSAGSVTRETSGLSALTASALARPVKAAAAISEELRADVGVVRGEVTKALENHLEFPFLASDTRPMHGLQDWSTTEWATQIEQHPELSALLAQTFSASGRAGSPRSSLNVVLHEDGSTPRDPCDLALELKKALRKAQPLSRWRAVVAYQNACLNASHELDDEHEAFYMSPGLLSNALFRRDFPLGVDKRIAQYRWRFAVENSGLAQVKHRESKGVERTLILCLIILFSCFIGYFLNYATMSELWTLDSTIVDASQGDYSSDVASRTKDRGIVASILTAFTYSGTVNASLDKFGKIDPATSTVLIGMFLGSTFGFLLDMMIGSDEGLREYLWSPQGGMKYALGSLASDRFGRYLVTIMFDMFFVVILFKHGYSTLVQTAGFSKNGREWIANAVVSSAIGILTFVVYGNLTRFEWAYPSGMEEIHEQWIQGSTMLLAVVVMNMVYLTSETRVRIDEPGINDPPIKLLVTGLNFFILYLLQANGVLDPSETPRAQDVTADYRDVNLPLKGVCESQARFGTGIVIFAAITVLCLGGVIFGTSSASLSEIRAELNCCACWRRWRDAPVEEVPQAATRVTPVQTSSTTCSTTASTTSSTTPPPSPGQRTRSLKPKSGQPSSTGSLKRQQSGPISTVTFESNDATQRASTRKDLAHGKLCLFFSYLLIIFVLMLIFAFVPFYSDDNEGTTRNETGWRTACDDNNVTVLDSYGLS